MSGLAAKHEFLMSLWMGWSLNLCIIWHTTILMKPNKLGKTWELRWALPQISAKWCEWPQPSGHDRPQGHFGSFQNWIQLLWSGVSLGLIRDWTKCSGQTLMLPAQETLQPFSYAAEASCPSSAFLLFWWRIDGVVMFYCVWGFLWLPVAIAHDWQTLKFMIN